MVEVENKEVIDGLHRVQFTDEEDKLFAYHILETGNGLVLFDTGMKDTPQEHIAPYLESIGYGLEDISMAVMTHVDADHVGGNKALREANPRVVIAAHKDDVPLIESKERMMEDRYGQFEDRGVEYPEEVKDILRDMMETDKDVDLRLQGGEEIKWKNGTVEIMHAPGHSAGSIIAYDEENDFLIGGDAIYAEGTITLSGTQLQPPPYERLDNYRKTIEKFRELDPELLLMSHFLPMEGGEVRKWVEQAWEWTEEFNKVLRSIIEDADSPLSVEGIIEEYVDREGSVGMNLDLAFPITSHLREMDVEEVEGDDGVPRYSL